MKKVKLICMSAVMALMLSSTTFVQAAGNTLDIDNAINKAIENSYQIKNIDISIEKAKNDYKEATRGSSGGNADIEAKYSIYQYTNLKEAAKNSVKFNLYNQYAAFINAKEALDLETQKFQNAEAKYKRAQLQLSLGLIGKPDLKGIEQSYYNEKSQLDKAKRAFDSVTKNINQLSGSNIGDTYNSFAKDIVEEKPIIKNYDEYVNDALKYRAEILNDNENIKVKKLEFDSVRSSGNPYVTSPEYVVGKFAVTSAENQLETDKIDISIEINGLYNDLQSKVQKLQSLTTNYNAEKKKYNEALQRYNLGMISKIDFEDSLSSFKGAEDSLKSAQRDVYLSKLKLEYASGIGTGAQSSN
ncbi:TolC family protein [Clostridium aciditolerans]|uniref:TolC family protein n=1 Tax=Clostridium aciditolerans TaxID=339861 RepID=A0A934HZZ0_9CLOT|nr:TolC family protein [Clostridium aciditolerans]MBI6873617.1 TolC family protein [Clostridium aciditolerans]